MNLLIYLYMAIGFATPNFQAQYTLVYHPDSTQIERVGQENFYLFIKENKQSYFCSENFLKADSIQGLRKTGLLSAQEYMADPKYRFRTAFMKFISKSHETGESRVFEKIAGDQFDFPVKNKLKWEIGNEIDTIAGLPCTKATTTFAGREYTAWFTMDIPISDGPYLFWGLPGLIVKIGDNRNHYDFTLVQFNEYKGQITEWPEHASRRKVIETNAVKAFDYREEARKDPMAVIDRHFGTVTFNGVPSTDKALRNKRSWDNNPIELGAPAE